MHPFETKKYIGMHNGTLHNHEILKQYFNILQKGATDSECIYLLLDKFGLEGLKLLEGAFALAFVEKSDVEKLYIVTNGARPLDFIVVDKKLFWIVRVSGEDRKNINKINFKIKNFDCSIKNSAYGYPDKIVKELRKLYKESIGGNRGRQKKLVGKSENNMAYRHLTRNSFTNVINSKTLDKIELIFLKQGVIFREIILKLKANDLTNELLKEIYPELPFAFNSLSEDLNLSKSSISNYILRNLPDKKKDFLREKIIENLELRLNKIFLALEIILKIRNFSWDIVESIEMINYDDYVYDFVVPEGHSFIGGDNTTFLH